MPFDNLTLAYLLEELKPVLDGSYVNKVAELKNGYLKIKLHSKQGSKDLILAPNDIFLTSFSLQARHGKTNFAVAAKKELYNKRLVSIEQNHADRVVTLKFLEHSIVLELMGEGNKILLDSQGKILSCQRNEKWADREVKKGIAYVYPKPRGVDPKSLDEKGLAEFFSKSNQNAIRALISYADISPLAAEETFHFLRIEKSVPAEKISASDAKKIAQSARDLYSLKKPASPVKYEKFAYPFALTHLAEKPVPIKSLNFYADETVSAQLSRSEVAQEKGVAEKEVSKLEFHAKAQGEARNKFEKQSQEAQKKAELIYEHYAELEELKNAIFLGVKAGAKEKEIMYKIHSAASKGNRAARLLVSIDLAKKKFTAEL
ncbi:MAG: NFACT family protein [archaeon]|nr:NFACT family protein [archaeon]